jgi:LysM repeat protein
LNQIITEYEKKQKEKVQTKSAEPSAPAGKEAITKKIKKEEAQPVIKGKYYRVRSGETVADIARKFGVSESKIRQENGIPKGKEPLANQNLFIPAK